MGWIVTVQIKDCQTGKPLQGVHVNWQGGIARPTDENGETGFDVNPAASHFWINLRREGYVYQEATIYQAAGPHQVVCMNPAPPSGATPPPGGLHVIDGSVDHVTLEWTNPQTYERIHVGWSRPGGPHHQLPHLAGNATTATIRAEFAPGDEYDLGVQGFGSSWASIRWRCPGGPTWFQHNSEPLGDTYLATSPAAVSWGPNRIDVFHGMPGNNKLLGHTWYDDTGWHSQARDFHRSSEIYGFAATSRRPGSLDVFYVSERQIWHVVHDGTRWDTQPIGGPAPPPGTHLAATSWGDDRLDLFYVGGNGRLIQRFRWNDDSNWSGEVELPGSIQGRPTVTSWGPNRLDIFYSGPDNAIHQTWYDGQNWKTANLGGAAKRDIVAVVSWGGDRLDLFHQGQTINRLFHRFHENGHWSGDIDLGEFPANPDGLVGNIVGLTAASWAPQRLDLFYCAIPGTLWHHWHSF